VEVGVVFAWDRALSADEAAAVSANPWNLFAEDDDDWLPSLGAGYSLSVGRAALGVSGGQVGMRVSRRLRAAPAALAVTAGPVATRAARRLRVDPAALAVLAGPTRMLVSRRFGVQPAVLAVAGKGVTLRAGRRLPVASASLVLAGGQVGMQYNPSMKPGEYTLPVSAAAMTLGGGSVGMRVSRRLHVAPSSLVVVGGDVLFRVGRNPGLIDVWSISPARIVKFESSGSRLVIFEGSGSRVVVFEGSGKRERFNEMSAKVPIKVGEKWTVDLDRDEISYHAADITAELADRNTTADADAVTVLLYGVELLEGPVIQVAMIDGVERTFVVVKLGGLGEDPPADWRWVARVPCMNGERFDKSTWFNEVDP